MYEKHWHFPNFDTAADTITLCTHQVSQLPALDTGVEQILDIMTSKSLQRIYNKWDTARLLSHKAAYDDTIWSMVYHLQWTFDLWYIIYHISSEHPDIETVQHFWQPPAWCNVIHRQTWSGFLAAPRPCILYHQATMSHIYFYHF